VNPDQTGFAEFCQTSRDSCLRAVAASTGDPDTAEDLVAEAFARAWAAWRTVRRHPARRHWSAAMTHSRRTAGGAGRRLW